MSLPPSQLRRLCHVIPVQGFPFKLNAWRDGCRIYATKLEHLLFYNLKTIEIINNKARHNLIDANCSWCSDPLDGAKSFGKPLGQTKVMQFHQRET